MRLIASHHLHPDDIDAFEKGVSWKEAVDRSADEEVRSILGDPSYRPVAEFLATLVAAGVVDLRVAFRPGHNGIYHNKIGLFFDEYGDVVSFVGSANETFSAWHPDVNHEGFEVFRSWQDGGEADRVSRHTEYFTTLWQGDEPGVQVVPFPDVARSRLVADANPNGIDDAAEQVRKIVAPRSRRPPDSAQVRRGQHSTKFPELHPHQQTVTVNWMDAGHRDIIDHATGSGKTIAALAIIRRWIASDKPAVILVHTRLLAHQWRQEIEKYFSSDGVSILDVGAGAGKAEWEPVLADFSRSLRDLGPRVVIATMQSARTETFRRRVQEGEHLLIVADEVHRIGSRENLSILEIECGGSLGLSATPERYGDPEGTAAILSYFGPKLEPQFTLLDAISAGRLVPYDYYVHRVALTPDEMKHWDELTRRVSQEYARCPAAADGSKVHSRRLQLLLIERSRILKNASAKVPLVKTVLSSEYSDGDRWLVYCDTISQLRKARESVEGLGYNCYEYHSAMDGPSVDTLHAFSLSGGVLFAIRCLDEGVNLPNINKALILASSTNPREFIQRRGRVLRTHPGKFAAHIHDALVTPAPTDDSDESHTPILRTELARALHFANMARNTAVAMELRLIATEAGITDAALREFSFESEEGD